MISRALPLLVGLTLVAQAPLCARGSTPTPPVETILQADQIAVKVVKSHRATIAKIIPLPLEIYAEAIRKRSSALVANVRLKEDARLRMPDMDVYLPGLARLHAEIIATTQLPASLARSYSEFLRMDVGRVGSDHTDTISARYVERLLPMAQIARSQGFPAEWRAGG